MSRTIKYTFSILAILIMMCIFPVLASAAIRIDAQPTNDSAPIGEYAGTSVKATGSGLKYEWYYMIPGSSGYKLDTARDTEEFFMKMTSSNDKTKVYCIITESNGNYVKTNTVTMYVGNPLKLSKLDTYLRIPYGTPVTLSIDVSGDGLNGQWYYRESPIHSWKKTSFTGATGTFASSMNADLEGYQFYFTVTDKYGVTKTSDIQILDKGETLRINNDLTHHVVKLGDSITLVADVTGEGVTYEWLRAEGTGSLTLVNNTTNKETVTITKENQEIYYTYIATDKFGNKVYSKLIVIYEGVPFAITRQPFGGAYANGETVFANVGVTGELEYCAWYVRPANGGSPMYVGDGTTCTFKMTDNYIGGELYCTLQDVHGLLLVSEGALLTSKPGITAQPEDTEYYHRNDYPTPGSVTVRAEGKDLTYKWFVMLPGTSVYTNVILDPDHFSISSSSGYSTLFFYMDESIAGAKVHCEITDAYGGINITRNATLTMSPRFMITEQPVGGYAAEGETISVTVKANGEGLKYQWVYMEKGSDIEKYSSITSPTYSVTMNSARSGRRVYCIITDKNGNQLTSDIASIYMRSNAKITTQPKSVIVPEGKTATVTLKATGDGLKYEWYYKNAGSATFYKTTAYTGNTYSLSMNASRNGRQLYCVVTDMYGNSVKSNIVTISMGNPAKITVQPKSVTVPEGKTASVTLKATGDSLKYEWYFKDASAKNFAKTTAFTGNTYSVSMTSARNGRQLYCVVTDKYGNSVKSNTVTISMGNPAKITVQPKSVTVAEGKTATVSLTATGDGLKYEWYYKNAGSTTFYKTTAYTGNTYSLSMNASRDGRQLYCVVTDKYGNSVKSNTVTISMATPVKITVQPKSVTVAEGKTATVSLTATGDGLKYEWYYKNAGSTTFYKTTAYTGNTYSLSMNASRDGRQLYCVVTDEYGNSVKSNTVTISMN